MQSNFEIIVPNKEIRVTGVLVNWQIINDTTGHSEPYEIGGHERLLIQLGAINTLIGLPVGNITGDAITYNGNIVLLSSPAQFKFDALFFKNIVPVIVQINNSDAVVSYTHRLTIIFETEENVIY